VANRACALLQTRYEQWLRGRRLEGTDTLELHHLYRAMDVLEAQGSDRATLYFRLADLLNLDVELIFYDTTSVHFEIDEMDQGYGMTGGRQHGGRC
jgi:hypothetical protein